MAFEQCVETLKAAAGRDLTDDEVEFLFKEVRRRRDAIKAERKADSLEDAALMAADEIANNIKLAAVIEKRNAALNLSKRIKNIEWAKQNYGTKIAEPLETLLVGTNRAVEGARDGVAQTQKSIVNNYLSGMTNDLVSADLMPIVSSGVMDREISRALFAIGRESEAADLAKLPKEAVSIAKIMNKWQEVARIDANREGAWINKAQGFIVTQSHDPYRINKAGFDSWREMALRTFDIQRMMGEAMDEESVNDMLQAVFLNLSTGNHLKLAPKADGPSGFTGPANLAKKLSQSRVIHFKDADAWFDYNTQFGAGNLRESFVGGLRARGESTGLMRVLGTNPESALKQIEDELVANAKRANDAAALKDFNNSRNELKNYLAAVDGSMNIPGNATAARWSANIRAIETMAKLGGMIASQLNDLAIYASSMRYAGRGFFSSMGEAVAGLGKGLKSKEKIELLSSLDIVLDSMVGELGRTGSFNEAGALNRATSSFMKYNLSQWWTESLRSASALGLSNNLALNKSLSFDQLNPNMQRSLGIYGIDSTRWDMLRSQPQKTVDGKEFITLEQVREMPDAMFENQIRNAGGKPTKTAIDNARRDLENKLRNYIIDNTSFAVLEPDAKTRAILLNGSQAGTFTGEMMRFLTQFKSFTGAYMQKTIGRELFGRGYMGDDIMGALRNGNGEFNGLAKLIVMSTIMGYGSMVIKDLLKGRSPRDITDPEQSWKVFLAAMVQGGGAGIYGDFLFGEASRFGGGTVESLAGPTVGAAGRFIDLYLKAIHGDDFAARFVNEVINNTPYSNLFYLRIALNYTILYNVQEMMNPGYLRRMEKRIEKENNQTFLVKPSEVVR